VVAQGAAHQQQRDQREQVGLDDPLLSGEPHVQISLHRRQRHVHDGGVEEDDRRRQDRRHER